MTTRYLQVILKIKKTDTVLATEDNLGRQASDVLVVCVEDVGVDGVFSLCDVLETCEGTKLVTGRRFLQVGSPSGGQQPW